VLFNFLALSHLETAPKDRTSGAEARSLSFFAARLKSCPDTKPTHRAKKHRLLKWVSFLFGRRFLAILSGKGKGTKQAAEKLICTKGTGSVVPDENRMDEGFSL
jgi:hypothetical protein